MSPLLYPPFDRIPEIMSPRIKPDQSSEDQARRREAGNEMGHQIRNRMGHEFAHGLLARAGTGIKYPTRGEIEAIGEDDA